MAGSIEDLKAAISSGLARPNRYLVNITFPTNDSSLSAQTVSILCESAELPGMHFATQEDRLWGPIRKVAYLPMFNDLSLVFMCDSDMKIRSMFDTWQTWIRGANTTGQDFKFMHYYDEYVADLTITQLNEKNEAKYTVKCIEVYPIEIVSQSFSYGEIDTYLKMEVKMAYRYYQVL